MVGTANGAALITDDKVTQVWDKELTDPYVQTVLLTEEDIWLGAFHGLQRIRDDHISILFEKWSVFSLEAAQKGGMWVGYKGLTLVDDRNEKDNLAWPKKIYDIIDNGDELFLATTAYGVVRIKDQKAEKISSVEATSLYKDKQGLWIAGGKDGLLGERL